MQPTEIKKNIYWVGGVDWDIRDFHGYSTPSGTTYNAYLLTDEKTVLFDTVKKPLMGDMCAHIKKIVDLEKIDWIVVNHVEMDHSGALPEMIELIKPEKIICSANGKRALHAHFAGSEDWPIEVVKSGDEIKTGEKTVQFMETKMLHWPDSMFSYIPEDKLLISQDAFGQHWATGWRFDHQVDFGRLMHESAKYYANILLPYSSLIQKLLSTVKEMGLEIDMIAPDHGLIWKENPQAIIDAYDQWSQQACSQKAVIVYDSMWHSTADMARAIADGLQEEDIDVVVFNMMHSHRADVITEVLDSRAVILGSSTLNNHYLPRMADVITYMKGLKPQYKIGAAFGSYGWGGESVKQLEAELEEAKMEIIVPGIKVQYVPTEDDLENCRELGRTVAREIKKRPVCHK